MTWSATTTSTATVGQWTTTASTWAANAQEAFSRMGGAFRAFSEAVRDLLPRSAREVARMHLAALRRPSPAPLACWAPPVVVEPAARARSSPEPSGLLGWVRRGGKRPLRGR